VTDLVPQGSPPEALTDHLLAFGPDLTDAQIRERWTIDDDDAAGWALRKLAAAQAERDRIKRVAQAELARIETWAADADRQVQHDVDFFTARLVEYRRMLEHNNPSLPLTYKLPGGSLTRRKAPEVVVIESPDEFTSWALDNAPDALDYKPKKTVIKEWHRRDDGQVVSPDGEPVPGVSVQRGDDRYDVKPAAPSAVSELEPF
jgi:hypothetical protein